MTTTDQDTTTRRVLHVPLTDAEFRALKIAAIDSASDMGKVTAAALRSTPYLKGQVTK